MTDHPMARTKLLTLVADHLGLEADQLTPEARIVEDLGWDSLEVVEVVLVLEEELDITLADGEVEGCRTLEDVLALPAVASRLEA